MIAKIVASFTCQPFDQVWFDLILVDMNTRQSRHHSFLLFFLTIHQRLYGVLFRPVQSLFVVIYFFVCWMLALCFFNQRLLPIVALLIFFLFSQSDFCSEIKTFLKTVLCWETGVLELAFRNLENLDGQPQVRSLVKQSCWLFKSDFSELSLSTCFNTEHSIVMVKAINAFNRVSRRYYCVYSKVINPAYMGVYSQQSRVSTARFDS